MVVGLLNRFEYEVFNTQPHVFESTKLPVCQDVKQGIVLHGVQIVRLRDRVDSFEGEVAVRRLLPPLSTRRIFRLRAFAEEVHGRPFNESKWVAARAFFRRNAPSDCSSFFCSELAAEAYQRIGLLPAPPMGLSANNYIPADFSSIYPGAHLPLGMGFRLESERLVLPSDTNCRGRRLVGPRVERPQDTLGHCLPNVEISEIRSTKS